jgi:D-sedoheptulose 7-phosphate isomerase
MSELSPITDYLCNAVDSAANNIECISNSLARASELVMASLLNDKKLIICGNGYSAPIASILTTSLMHQQDFERPSLPAINISIDATTISAIAKDGNYHNVYAKQIRAIGQEGDTLIVLSIDGNCSNIVQAIQTAHEKDIQIISLCGFSQGNMSAVIQPQDVEVLLETSSIARAMEAQLFAVNALCHQIECQLFGAPH